MMMTTSSKRQSNNGSTLRRDSSIPATATATATAIQFQQSRFSAFLRPQQVLVPVLLSLLVGSCLYYVPGMLLEIAFFPAHGRMLPHAIPDTRPRLTYPDHNHNHMGDSTTTFSSSSLSTSTTSTPSLSTSLSTSTHTMIIPRILHCTYTSKDALPWEWKASLQAWHAQNPHWEVRFWSDDDIYAFVQQSYPDYWDMFLKYKYMIQRVDSVRYMILNKFGGVYADLDIYPARSLDLLLQQFEDAGKNVILAKTLNAGLTNAFMASAKQSPFMTCVIDNLPFYQHRFYHIIGWRHWEVLSSAGSTFLWGMGGHCLDPGVGVLSTQSFRKCSVCDSWGSSTPPGDDWCDTEWLRHSSTNSSWHESKSVFHTVWFNCTMALFCKPFRACLLLGLLVVFGARALWWKRHTTLRELPQTVMCDEEEGEPLTGGRDDSKALEMQGVSRQGGLMRLRLTPHG